MSLDDVWKAFLPKVVRGNNANLSQMSTTSSVRNGGLSLSSRNPVRNKCQIPSKSASFSPRTPISKQNPPLVTQKSSSRKSTPRKTPPSDGLSQKKIDSYFRNTFKKPETPKRMNYTLTDLSSDSSQDDNDFQDDHERFKSSSVSRELFPAKSEGNSCLESKNLTLESDANIQNKENQNFMLQNTSTPKSSKEGNVAKDVPKSPLVFRVTSTVKSDGSKILKLMKKNKPESAQDSPITKNKLLLQMSTEHVANGEDLSANISNPVECDHNSIDKTVITSSKPSKNLDRNAENLALAENPQEWMIPPHKEAFSKQTAVSQWKNLMKVMNSGNNSSSRSTESSSSTRSNSSASSGSCVSYQYKRNQGYWNRNRSSERRNCKFYKLIEGTKFAVDAFSYGTIPGITHYFLTHFHFDHYMGLNKKFSHPIYCSSVTAKLVSLKIKLDPSLIRRLDPGQTVVVDNTKITALDANHCPGSVMLLFELPGGKTHLHVGDFRAHICMESYHALWNVDIDRLYLDTTYCDPAYTFPSQQVAIESILTMVNEAIASEPKTLIVCGTYTIGKERVFAAVAECLKTKIWAPADKRRVLLCVKEGLQDLLAFNNVDIDGGAGRELGIANALNLLTTIKEEAQVHVLSMNKLTVEYLEKHLEMIKGMKFNNVLAFRPTGWAHGRTGKGKDATLVNSSALVKIFEVAYSEHSSFLEMARFVKFVRPKSVIKTVNVGSKQQHQAMEKHINTWLSQVKSNFPLPNSCNDSPKTFQVTEEQRKAGKFQPKKMFKMSSDKVYNAVTPLPLMGDSSENSYDNMRTASLPTQILSCRSQENQTK